MMADISAGFDRGNVEAVARASHTLKGAASNLGAKETFEAAMNLNVAAGEGDLARAADIWCELQNCIERLMPVLATEAGKTSSAQV